jgi:hypothetical protein
VFEEKRETIKTLVNSVASLQTKKAADVGVADVGLQGNFHCLDDRDDIELFLRFCDLNVLFNFQMPMNLCCQPGRIPSFTICIAGSYIE